MEERTNFLPERHLRFEMDNEEIKHSAVRFSTEKQLFPRHLKSLTPTHKFIHCVTLEKVTELL